MVKGKILKFIQKYNITTEKIIIFSVVLMLFVLRFLVQDNILIKPVQILFNLYADILIALARIFLYFINIDLIFDFAHNQILNKDAILKIGRFYFSINQIISVFILIIVTKSPLLEKVKTFLFVLLIFTLYNAIRISIHTSFPNTISVHNWVFNVILIPRWIMVLAFAYSYWKKFPYLKELIKRKFDFSDVLLKSTIIKIGIIIILYHLVVIITFNDYFILNGNLLISFVLNVSKHFIEFLGYDCWINNRLIYGTNASLYMDDACLGIDLMFLFASFIVVTPGAIKHKIWFIPMGLIIIVLLNCLRVILIFANISENKTYSIPLEIHDVFTYPVLVFTLLLWIVWINKFLKRKMDYKINSGQ